MHVLVVENWECTLPEITGQVRAELYQAGPTPLFTFKKGNRYRGPGPSCCGQKEGN